MPKQPRGLRREEERGWGRETRQGHSQGHVLGDEQLLLGAGLHVEVAVVDEQHLQDVLGELGSPGHVQPRPQQLWGERGSTVRPWMFAGGALGKRFPPSPR